MTDKTVSVIIPSYRNPKCLDICIDSALQNKSDFSSVELVVILDGFGDESRHIINKYNNISAVLFIELQENAGMPHALNVGVYAASSEWILIVNDDNVFPKDWNTILLDDATHGLVITPNQIERGQSIFDFVQADYGGVDDFNFRKFTKEEPSHRIDSLTNDGEIFPFFMEKQYYMACGGFDTIYPSPFICDWDFFLKLELIGIKFLRSRKLNFYHFGSVATKNGNERHKFVKSEVEAADIFYQKWNFHPIRNTDNSHLPQGVYTHE